MGRGGELGEDVVEGACKVVGGASEGVGGAGIVLDASGGEVGGVVEVWLICECGRDEFMAWVMYGEGVESSKKV